VLSRHGAEAWSVLALLAMAVGALNAIGAAHKSGQVSVGAEILTDCTEVNLIKKGTLSLVLGVPAVFTGQLGMATAIRLIEGRSVPKKQVIPGNIYTPANIKRAPLHWEIEPQYMKGCWH
jgi:ABC-type sugar transport system substrate-binding protein